MRVVINADGYVESYSVVGNIDGSVEVQELPEGFFDSPFTFRLEGGSLVRGDRYADIEAEETRNAIRKQRRSECFPYINRGQLWYTSLNEDMTAELETWYHAWLDAPQTLTIPDKPEWLV